MRASRVVGSIVLCVVAVGVLFAIGKGLAPLFPTLAVVLRALLHPFGLIGLVVLALLWRLSRGSRRVGNGAGPR